MENSSLGRSIKENCLRLLGRFWKIPGRLWGILTVWSRGFRISLRESYGYRSLTAFTRWLWGILTVWSHGFRTSLKGPYGYRSLATLIGIYVGLYAIMEARHERQMNRALFERNTFISMVSSGDQGTFIAAIKHFGPLQTISIFSEPLLLYPWTWWRKETPNMDPLWRWAEAKLPSCTSEKCGYSENEEDYRIDLREAILQGAKLQDVNFSKSDLQEANLREANLQEANLSRTNLQKADLWGSDLRDAKLKNANLSGTVKYLRVGVYDREHQLWRYEIRAERKKTNLANVKNWTSGQLVSTYWNEETIWPDGYTPPCPSNLPHNICKDAKSAPPLPSFFYQ